MPRHHSDEVALGQPVYNWSYVDQIYDGLLESGVRPFVEMSFMPRALARSLTPHAFWYHPLPSPPKDYARWEELVYNFAEHLVDRNGADEVSEGGPATAQAADLSKDVFGTDERMDRTDMVGRAVQKVKSQVESSARPDRLQGPWLADDIRNAALLANNTNSAGARPEPRSWMARLALCFPLPD